MRQLSPDSPRSTAGSSSGMQLRAYASTKQRPAASAASRTPSTCVHRFSSWCAVQRAVMMAHNDGASPCTSTAQQAHAC
jgi:hypothetical protein